MEGKKVIVERTFETPVKNVWEAITDKNQMKEWYFNLDEFKLEVGFQFTFKGQGHKGEQYLHICTITEIVPLKKLQYSWEYKGHSGYSLVTFELFDKGDKTMVRLTHSGLDSFPGNTPDFSRDSFNEGWNMIIGKMLPEFLTKHSFKKKPNTVKIDPMENIEIQTVEAQMLIRRPVEMVFQAFIDPSKTINFWFTRSSGPLEVGKVVTWEWEMYGVSARVFVKEIIRNKKISMEWGDPGSSVDFEFNPLKGDSTYVVIRNYGFKETGDDLIKTIKDSTGGFTTVLDGLKAYLEHSINLNLIRDKYPKEVGGHGH